MQWETPPPISDAMVVAAANGDQSQRQQLFQWLTPQVRIMINARLNPTLAQAHLVEDLVQETVLALSAAPPKGLALLERRTVAGLRAFVSTIVSRRVADALRQKARLHHNGQAPLRSLDSTVNVSGIEGTPLWAMLSASGASPLSQADRADLCQRVLAALAQLKPDYRSAITLAFFDQLETRDIAEQMGVSRPAASMLLVRALKTLRRELTGSSAVVDQPQLRAAAPSERK